MSTSSYHKTLNPEAPEFIPSIYTSIVNTTTCNIINHSFYSPPPIFSPPNPNSFYYFLSPQTPPPPQQPLSPILHPSQFQTVTGDRVKASTNTRRKLKGINRNKNVASSSVDVVKQPSTGNCKSGGGGGGGGAKEKIERVVKYGECFNKGKRFDVVEIKDDAHFTTVMIRNIPSKYTRKMLLQFLDQHCVDENEKEALNIDGGETEEQNRVWSAIDFLYMPMDFNGWNKSYAFVNFTDARAVWKFYNACHNQKWEFFHSNKIREIACAKIQGKGALVEHFGHTAFACESDEYLPVCFNPPRDGSNKGQNSPDDQNTDSKVVGKRISFRRY